MAEYARPDVLVSSNAKCRGDGSRLMHRVDDFDRACRTPPAEPPTDERLAHVAEAHDQDRFIRTQRPIPPKIRSA